MRSDGFETIAAGRDGGIVLDVLDREDRIKQREVAVVEEAGKGLESECLIGERGESLMVFPVR